MGHKTQHRTERETVRGREVAATRKENQQLKRQVARLQKQIAKLEARAEPESDQDEVRSPAEKPVTCICGACTWTSFTTPGGKVIRACKACKARAL
jgi:hypothetical protein